jgi:CHAP domain
MLGRAAGVAARGQVDRPAVPGSLGATIASIAEGQEGVEDKPSDTYCNPYSAYRGSGTACSNGLRATEWCADFAAWAWRQAGALFTYGSGTGDINAEARSFYNWANAHGTWHAAGSGYAPQPGDVAVYGSSAADASHVGIVVGSGSSGPDVVKGDWAIQAPYTGPPTAVVYVANESSSVRRPPSAGGEPLVGFASPLGLGDGSFVQVSGTTAIYEIAGEAPLYVSSWTPFGGPQPYSVISQAQFDALNPVSANGTMIRSAQTGAIYIVAGGAPLWVSSCADFNGCAGDVNVDQRDIDNAGSAASHLSLVLAGSGHSRHLSVV